MSEQLNRIITEICAEEGINLSSFSENFVLFLQKNGKKMFVFGNKFANNNASSDLICDDKASLSEFLTANGIPNIKHIFFGSPTAEWYFSDEKTDRAALCKMLKNSPGGLVLKDNRGSGGRNVFFVKTEKELFEAAEKVFSVSDSLAVSDFCEIRHEYRVLMLNGEFKYAFEKIRRFAAGNGIDTAQKLLTDKYGKNTPVFEKDKTYIPQNGEIYLPEWRHNLGKGAVPQLVTDEKTKSSLCELAKRCTDILNLNFASVDIIDDGKDFKILEINSGVMTDSFSSYSPEYYSIAKDSIKIAVMSILG